MSKANKVGEAIRQALQLFGQGDLEGAEKLIRKIIKFDPVNFDALHMLGAILATRNDLRGAISAFTKAIAVNPRNAAVQLNMATVLSRTGAYGEAVGHYRNATELAPAHAAAWSGYGDSLHNLRRCEEAVAAYDQALRIAPDDAATWANRGISLTALKRYDEAVISHERALSLASADDALMWDNYAMTLQSMGRHEDALSAYEKALRIDPGLTYVRGRWLHTRMMLCEWFDIDRAFARVGEGIESGDRACSPFIATTLPLSARLQRKCAELFVEDAARALNSQVTFPAGSADDKITVGYFSADFYEHPTTYLMAELLELHDRSKFRVVAFSFGPERHDEMWRRVGAAVDEFIDVRNKTDEEIAALSRSLRVDIAVDLKGFTEDHRVGIFAHRAAPVQVNYLGFPGTLGAPYIEYLIADHALIDDATAGCYSEKIVYMPHSYQVNDRTRRISANTTSPAEHGLPEQGFVFCCFNNSYKITPDVFEVWMRLLSRIPGSVLWLLAANPAAAVNLRREAEKRGVAGSRLVFAPRAPLPDHLARHRLAHLFLDTFHYNAHTTASDALWAGLPVLTRSGETFASRVAASLLTAAGLPELITRNADEYEALAYELATRPDELSRIRSKLRDERLTCPLFDTPAFTRHLEAAYMKMHERRVRGLPPVHIDV